MLFVFFFMLLCVLRLRLHVWAQFAIATDFSGLLAHHSRTSSSASSAGSSYVSSTDSNKDSPRKTSPAHSRQSSHSSTSMRQSSSAENDRNIINANYHNGGNQNGTVSLPHYQLKLSEKLRGGGDCFSGDDDCCYEDDCDEMLSVASSSVSPSALNGGDGADRCDHNTSTNGGQYRQQPPSAADTGSLYGTIRPHTISQNHTKKRPAMPEPASATPTTDGNGTELNYRTLNGDLIRSVQPPGKGKALPYKVGG